LGQNDYSLEDINESSDFFGQNEGTSNTKLPKLETQTTQLIQTTNTTNKNNNTKTKTGKFKAARLKPPEMPYLPPSLTFYTET
jgi:hypothetical protein